MSSKQDNPNLNKILDKEMKNLIGMRNWNVWRRDIEPEMYSSIVSAMYEYGERKFQKAQAKMKKEILKIKI
jgi:hypothetical protein